MPARQVGDGQHGGQRVDPGDPDRLVRLQVLAVPEPLDEEGRVPLDDEAGLPDPLGALHQVPEERERLYLRCD